MTRARSRTALAVLLLVLACSRGEKPLATFGETKFTAIDYADELGTFLEQGQTLNDVGMTPEAFLRRVVRFRMLLAESERRVPTLAPTDVARLAAYQEMFLKEELVKEAYPESPISEDALHARYEAIRQKERLLVHFVGTSAAVDSVRMREAMGVPFDSAAAYVVRRNASARVTPLGYQPEGRLPPAWEKIGWSLQVGQTSEPFTTAQGVHLIHCKDVRDTSFETVRPRLVEAVRQEELVARIAKLETDMLDAAHFRPDSLTLDRLSGLIRQRRDSLSVAGGDPATATFPRLAAPDRERPFFSVFDTPFSVGALADELANVPLARWPRGSERTELGNLARRRAVSAVVDRVARSRGLYDREDLKKVIERKRRELVMNTLLRELWRGVGATDADVRAFLAKQGQDMPGEAGMQLLVAQINRQREADRLEAYLDTLSIRNNVQYFPERLGALGDRAFSVAPPTQG